MIKSIVFFVALCSLTLACPDEKNCVECNFNADPKNAFCAVCENSFYNPDTKTCVDKLAKSVANCKSYKKDTANNVICDKCAFGHVLVANECKACDSKNCAVCSSTNLKDCTACFNKFTLVNGTCSDDAAHKCELANCDICGTYDVTTTKPTQCFKCDDKFAVDATYKCVASSANCYQINAANEKACDSCNWGYYITKDHTCTKNGGGKAWLWLLLLLIPVVLALTYFGYTKFAQKREEDNIYNTV